MKIIGDSHGRGLYITLLFLLSEFHSHAQFAMPFQMSNCPGGLGLFTQNACRSDGNLPVFSDPNHKDKSESTTRHGFRFIFP